MSDINIIPNSTIYFKSALLLPSIVDFSNKKVVIVTSNSVKDYALSILDKFLNNNITAYAYYLPDGENNKNLENALNLTNFLSEKGISRSDILINVGGGTVCDLGAFVASVYMRGIKYVNVPTTLLCACDAAIGGKTAIDLNGYKNFWGTFYQPFAVIIDCDFISTLSDQLITYGLSEIVKYAILDAEFCSKLDKINNLNEIKQNLQQILYHSLSIKAEIVLEDERDYNKRKILNLGHTIAHAVESSSNYEINHAEAVAFGLLIESKLAYELSIISNNRLNSIINLINKFLSTNITVQINDLIPFMLKDKKNLQGKIAFSLPTENSAETVYLTTNQTTKLLEKIL